MSTPYRRFHGLDSAEGLRLWWTWSVVVGASTPYGHHHVTIGPSAQIGECGAWLRQGYSNGKCAGFVSHTRQSFRIGVQRPLPLSGERGGGGQAVTLTAKHGLYFGGSCIA